MARSRGSMKQGTRTKKNPQRILGGHRETIIESGKSFRITNYSCNSNGLRPRITQQVLQHEPMSLLDIRKWGTIAESSEVNNGHHTTNAVLKEIQAQLSRMQITPIAKRLQQRPPNPSYKERRSNKRLKHTATSSTIRAVVTTRGEVITPVATPVIKHETMCHRIINPTTIIQLLYNWANRTGVGKSHERPDAVWSHYRSTDVLQPESV